MARAKLKDDILPVGIVIEVGDRPVDVCLTFRLQRAKNRRGKQRVHLSFDSAPKAKRQSAVGPRSTDAD